MYIKDITRKTFEEEVLKSDKLVIVDFWAAWCAPCRVMCPMLEELSQENPNIKVVKVNVDDEPEIAEKYDVMSMPTLLFFDRGKVVEESIGLVSKEQILNILPR